MAAACVSATQHPSNSMSPSNRSTARDNGQPGRSKEEYYHWVVTRNGELANSVRDVDDPDEVSRYSEFDFTIKQRRKRSDDVTAVRRGKTDTLAPNCRSELRSALGSRSVSIPACRNAVLQKNVSNLDVESVCRIQPCSVGIDLKTGGQLPKCLKFCPEIEI